MADRKRHGNGYSASAESTVELSLNYEESVYSEQVKILFEQLPLGLIAAPINSIIIVAVLWNVVSHNMLLSWLAFMLIVQFLRYILYLKYYKASPPVADARRWGDLFNIGMAASGIAWGLAAIMIFPPYSLAHQALLICLIAGMVAGAVATYSSIAVAFTIFVIPAVLPLSVRLFLEGGGISYALGTLAVIFALVMNASARRISRSIETSLRLRFENLELINSLEKSKRKLEKATILKDRFVSLVSHDLRSPLALIRMLLKKGMKEMEGRIKPSDKEILTNSTEVVNEMEHFIDSLLKVERFQMGLLTIEKIPVNIFELVEKLKTEMMAESSKKEQEIINEIPKDMIVNADEILLIGVFRNLLLNAIKFSYRGGTISIYSPDDGIECVAVADTGVGIQEKSLKTIFDYGVKKSTKGTDGETGYGLGLQLCRDIIEAHGGKIEVTSTVGEGSVFQLRIPSEKGNELLAGGSEKEDAIEIV